MKDSETADTVPESEVPISGHQPHPQALAILQNLANVLPNNTELPPADLLRAVRSLTFLLTSINQPQPQGVYSHNVSGLNAALELLNITEPQQRPVVITVTGSGVKVTKPYTKQGPPSAR